tara:strand:- start:602 stop:784 length:183 start_codon:yes stop_codon:yes gene_type:complete
MEGTLALRVVASSTLFSAATSEARRGDGVRDRRVVGEDEPVKDDAMEALSRCFLRDGLRL